MSTETLRMPSVWTTKPIAFKQRDYFRRSSSLGRKIQSSCDYVSRIDESIDMSHHLENWLVTDEPSYNIVLRTDFDIALSDTLKITLPNQLDYLFDSIFKTKYILALEENWDGDGAERYNESTLKQSINFLIHYALWISKNHNSKVFLPKITHGPDGSIDIVWEENDYRLVINIEKGGEKASFYYDNGKNLSQFIEGSFEVDNCNFKLIPVPTK